MATANVSLAYGWLWPYAQGTEAVYQTLNCADNMHDAGRRCPVYPTLIADGVTTDLP